MGLLESSLNGKLADLNLTKQVAALLLGVSGTDMSRWLTGVRPFPGQEALRLNKLLDDLLRIRDVIFPLRLPLQDISSLRVLLERYHDSGLDRITDRETLAEMREQISAIQSL
jgi:hypothetical protein